MGLIRATSRLLTGATYAWLGYDAVRQPGARPEVAAETLAALRRVVPLPADDEMLVRANGAVQAGAGAALALGVMPRLSAMVLVGSMVPTTAAGHAFWKIEDPTAKKLQRVQFLKNVAMIGGLLSIVASRKH